MNIPSKNALILANQLANLVKGINKNKETWPVTNVISEENINEIISELKKMIIEITNMENELTEKRRNLNKFTNEQAKTMYVKIRDQVYSIHGKRSEKLRDFDLKELK